MGQKVNPIGFRLGIVNTWNSKWFAERDYAKMLHEDLRIRKSIKEKLFDAGISKILIERAAGKVKINVHTARPGIVIGRRGAEVERLQERTVHHVAQRDRVAPAQSIRVIGQNLHIGTAGPRENRLHLPRGGLVRLPLGRHDADAGCQVGFLDRV